MSIMVAVIIQNFPLPPTIQQNQYSSPPLWDQTHQRSTINAKSCLDIPLEQLTITINFRIPLDACYYFLSLTNNRTKVLYLQDQQGHKLTSNQFAIIYTENIHSIEV